MAINFERRRVVFTGCKGGVTTKSDKVDFHKPIERVQAAISGFQIQFEGSEHPVQNMQAYVKDINWEGTNANIKVDLAIRDNTGTYDDTYGGWVDVLFIANLL